LRWGFGLGTESEVCEEICPFRDKMLRSPNNPNTSYLQENLEKSSQAEGQLRNLTLTLARLEVSSDLSVPPTDGDSGFLDTPTPCRKSIFGHDLTGFDLDLTRKTSKLKHPSCRAKFPQSHSPRKSILIAGRFGDLSPSKKRSRVEKRRKKADDLVLLGLLESIKLN
jgi:hypothetical protein